MIETGKDALLMFPAQGDYVSLVKGLETASLLTWGRFIEENHAYKLAQHAAQRKQPGPMSQDLMSYWGLALLSPTHYLRS